MSTRQGTYSATVPGESVCRSGGEVVGCRLPQETPRGPPVSRKSCQAHRIHQVLVWRAREGVGWVRPATAKPAPSPLRLAGCTNGTGFRWPQEEGSGKWNGDSEHSWRGWDIWAR